MIEPHRPWYFQYHEEAHTERSAGDILVAIVLAAFVYGVAALAGIV